MRACCKFAVVNFFFLFFSPSRLSQHFELRHFQDPHALAMYVLHSSSPGTLRRILDMAIVIIFPFMYNHRSPIIEKIKVRIKEKDAINQSDTLSA
ncbi:hypothetical protein BJX62DRAFT_199685 [Aspergillus germanicus]